MCVPVYLTAKKEKSQRRDKEASSSQRERLISPIPARPAILIPSHFLLSFFSTSFRFSFQPNLTTTFSALPIYTCSNSTLHFQFHSSRDISVKVRSIILSQIFSYPGESCGSIAANFSQVFAIGFSDFHFL